MSEDTPVFAMIRADVSGDTAEIGVPSGDIESIEVSIATGETQNERIWNPEYVDTSDWDLTVTDGVLVLDLPDDLPDHAQCVVTVEYK